jgi:hypothetical protein
VRDIINVLVTYGILNWKLTSRVSLDKTNDDDNNGSSVNKERVGENHLSKEIGELDGE